MTNVMTLGEVATYINGRAFKPSEWEETGLPIIRIQNLTESNKKYNYSSKTFDEKFRIKNDDLLFAWSASLGAFIWKGGDAWLNQHIFKVEPKPFIQKRYLYYFLLYVIADLYAKTHGSGMVHITKGPFMSTPIQVPSRPEQKRIVEKIDELFSDLDAAESELRVAKEKLNIYKQQIIDSAFIGNNFDYRKLSDVIVANPRNGFSPKGVTYETPYKNLTLSATTSGRFKENCFKYIDQEIATDSHLWVKHDDILIQRANTLDYVGTATVYPGVDNKYVYPDIMMKFHTKDDYLPWFICYQLQSSPIRRYYQDHATGTAGNMPKINQRTVNNTPICICNKRLQQAIISSIEKKKSACENLYNLINSTLEKSKALRQGILKQAFEGGLV